MFALYYIICNHYFVTLIIRVLLYYAILITVNFEDVVICVLFTLHFVLVLCLFTFFIINISMNISTLMSDICFAEL